MLALPAAPAPSPRRQLFVGTAVVCAAIAALTGGLLGLWLNMRSSSRALTHVWLPKGVEVPEVASNTMLLAFIPACVFAQWAVYSAKRGDKTNTGLALGLTALMGLAIVNAQAFVYSQMKVPASGPTAYNAMFYAVTGIATFLVIAGMIYSIVAAFHYLGGRQQRPEIVSAHALYWYFLAVMFFAVWLVVYVTK